MEYLCGPLDKKRCQNVKFVWQKSKQLRKILISELVLIYYDPKKKLVATVNAFKGVTGTMPF